MGERQGFYNFYEILVLSPKSDDDDVDDKLQREEDQREEESKN